MQDAPQVNSTVDAVRCLYLARVAEQKGYAEAAERWQQLAEGWLNRLKPAIDRDRQSPVDAS